MFLQKLRYLPPARKCFANGQRRYFKENEDTKPFETCRKKIRTLETVESISLDFTRDLKTSSTAQMFSDKQSIVLPFDEVPGPKIFKYISIARQHLSDVGTQVTAGILTIGLKAGSYFKKKSALKNLSTLFDEYGPVVRFVSPVGRDIVLLNHPEHIAKVYNVEGDQPIRSAFESLEKYRIGHRSQVYGGLFTVHGQEWDHHRSIVEDPLNCSLTQHVTGINDVCENFVKKIYKIRNHSDEIPQDLCKEIHKWAFDCMGLIIFSKQFSMLETELVNNQCDISWLYHSLEQATEAIIKCESGLQLWKLFPTPSWNSLIKNCDGMDSLIGKLVMEAEQQIKSKPDGSEINKNTLMNAMLVGENKMCAEDIASIIMDMLLIGVNTITSTMSFMLYYIAKHQKVQNALVKEIKNINLDVKDLNKLTNESPYLQACIKETLRLVPPIPVMSRVLPKNIVLDGYNIPRGTLIIMSTQDSSLKDGNYDDAAIFSPERWLNEGCKDYHSFASIPFGYGARKCLGQISAETTISLLTIKLLQKYKLEYHYGDIQPTRTILSKPNKPLKIRFLDRV